MLLGAAAGCASASRSRRTFSPAAPEDAARALAAWSQALARAESLGAARLLYDARISQGLIRVSGTLAVRVEPGTLEASLTGPFGSPIARYEDGALRGEGMRPLAIDPGHLRSLLAGVWKESVPEVAGLDGDDALLRWRDAVEGVLSVPAARFLSLSISRVQGAILATYPGAAAPWPERIVAEDLGSGNTLRLVLIGREAL